MRSGAYAAVATDRTLDRVATGERLTERGEDPHGESRRAAPLDELDERVEVEPPVAGELAGECRREPCAAKLLLAPRHDARVETRRLPFRRADIDVHVR